MRPLGGGGGGRSVLPAALAATAVTAAAAGTTAYVCRARLASVVASRVVGARIVVGAVDIDVDLLGRRRRRLRRARADVGAGGGADEREEERRRGGGGGPAVGVRDVVLYDDADRVALRVPALRVQLSTDDGGTAVGAARGRVMDVDVVRPHAFLIFDNLLLTRSNWGGLAAAAAKRFGGAEEADAPPPPPPPSRRGHRGVPPRAAAPTDAPAPGGVRLRRVRLADGADLSVTSSVLGANGGTPPPPPCPGAPSCLPPST